MPEDNADDDASVFDVLKDSIEALVESSQVAYQKVDDTRVEVLQTFREQLDRARGLRATASEFIGLFELTVGNAHGVITEADLIQEMFEKIGAYTERIEGLTEQVKSHNDQVNQVLDQVEQVIDSSLQDGVTEFHSIIDNNVATYQQFTEDVEELLENKVQGLLSNIGQKRDEAVEKIDQVLLADVPDLFGGETAEFVEKVELLRKNGMTQVGKITDVLGEITEKTRTLTELIETAKPILDYVRQVL